MTGASAMDHKRQYIWAKIPQKIERGIEKSRRTVHRAEVDGCVLLTTKLWQHRGRVERGEIYISDPCAQDQRAVWRAMVQAIANEKHFQPGWVSHMYKARWGEWPSGRAGRSL